MNAAKRRKNKKKFFTPAQANAMLPLLRSILRDVTALAAELTALQEQFQAMKGDNSVLSFPQRQKLEELETEFERGRDRLQDYLQELESLGIELKDPFLGLVDFRAMVDGREVFLCWRMDEQEVSHWHELDAGFAGRQKLREPVTFN